MRYLRIMKMIRKFLIPLTAGLVWLVLVQYFLGERFEWHEPAGFSGMQFFNPYQSVDGAAWLKCNFHAHSHAWNGLTNGHGTPNDIHDAYDSLGYDVHAVSNYHEIDTSLSQTSTYMPAYEHGYNVRKTHQQILGGKSILWNDYLFPQTLNNKQSILNELGKDTNTVIVLNHPALGNGYAVNDFKYLTGYDCIEVLNPSVDSFEEWDVALTAGKRINIVGNDDIHNVISKERLGLMCTYVQSKEKSTQSILKSLKNGQGYAAKIGPYQEHMRMPMLKELRVDKEVITINLSQTAVKVSFIGEHGIVRKEAMNVRTAQYRIQNTDPYIRIIATFPTGTKLYFNPVIRFSGSFGPEPNIAKNNIEMGLYRVMGILLFGVYCCAVWLWNRRSKRPIFVNSTLLS